ncbi:hypothetical protein B0T17DRAFT_587418 [Bombardia bombarda]|uniref:Prolyl 4-hydroxylase alpha subunit domain-containing protein n=1 Tax=Bombardia bombarda TaxID=252184 RepID=A0AA39XLD6_9PEZI|nr:hypothetical protein B0T17DRAFT_587418 [Bombardia bombarda]
MGASSSTPSTPPKPIQTNYKSKPIPIPSDFLTVDPPDHRPITLTPVDWLSSSIPENAGLYAVVLDNVISPSECATLLQLAEASVLDTDKEPDGSSWTPALVNIGPGFEILDNTYRNSDRIIWDQQEVVDRLWARCAGAPGLVERLGVIENEERITGRGRDRGDSKWVFGRVNQRMRFLRYGKGQFFRPHCDGVYSETADERTIETLFTVHLYLNSCKAEGGDELVGGATSFFSSDEKRKMDVNCKAGRVLIFQHRRVKHSGDDVVKGTKYSMRTDVLYEMARE